VTASPQNTRSRLKRWTMSALALTIGGGVVAMADPAAAAPTEPAPQWSVGQTTTPVSQVLSAIKAADAPSKGIDGRGVGVALIDTGVVPVPGLPASQIVNGPDLSVESQVPKLRYLDGYGHGTHLAGIIVGNDPEAGYVGIAPKAKLTSVKVASSTGAVDVTQVMAAVDWVVAHKNDDPANPIRVITLAYGTDSTQDARMDPLTYAVENAWRNGIVVVVAAGNAGSTSHKLTNPAADPYVLTVGSVSNDGTSSRKDDDVSTFTSWALGRKVDLVAPGESIVSLRNPGSYIDVKYPTARVGERLFRGSGTSQATAVTAGAVALLLQKRPNLTPDQVKDVLKDSGDRLRGGNAHNAGVRELNLGKAFVEPSFFSHVQWWNTPGTGTGSIEKSRGSSHLTDNGVELKGERDLFGPLSSREWAAQSAAGKAWKGGVWMGRRMAGDGWTGTSWASRTWAAGTWPGTSWSSSPWFSESDWDGRYWAGRYWAAGSWSGRFWAASAWKANDWAI
jgi:serine protease AprX